MKLSFSLFYLQLTSNFIMRMIGFCASIFVARHWRRAPMSWRVGASTSTRLRTESSDGASSEEEEGDEADRSSLGLTRLWFDPLTFCSCPSFPLEAIFGTLFCCFLLMLLLLLLLLLSGLNCISSPVAVRRMRTLSGINLRLLRCQETVASGLPNRKQSAKKRKWQIRFCLNF